MATQTCFMFALTRGNDPIWLAHIFQRGWFNHQLVFESIWAHLRWSPYSLECPFELIVGFYHVNHQKSLTFSKGPKGCRYWIWICDLSTTKGLVWNVCDYFQSKDPYTKKDAETCIMYFWFLLYGQLFLFLCDGAVGTRKQGCWAKMIQNPNRGMNSYEMSRKVIPTHDDCSYDSHVSSK